MLYFNKFLLFSGSKKLWSICEENLPKEQTSLIKLECKDKPTKTKKCK